MINIVVACHREDVMKKNIAISPAFEKEANSLFGEILVMRGFTNVPNAYNAANFILPAKYTMYVHEDVFLPDYFFHQVHKAIAQLPDDWGVIGVTGVKYNSEARNKKECHGYILDRGKHWGSPIIDPVEVDTLDEMLVITQGDICFDPTFELDFYAADLCMQAKELGRKVYAVPGFCHHNSTREFGGRTPAFYEAEKAFREKWKHKLPIVTTCATLL